MKTDAAIVHKLRILEESVKRRGHRRIGGVMFECLTYGSWLSLDGRLALVLMMDGHPDRQWELYLTRVGTGHADKVPESPGNLDTDFLCDDFVCGSLDFDGRALAEDAARLSAKMPAAG
jgi:hypothetical protein